MKSYVLYITTGTSPGSGTDADVYVTLQGILGDTGKRKLIRKVDDNFTEGKVCLPFLYDILYFAQSNSHGLNGGRIESRNSGLQYSMIISVCEYIYLKRKSLILM